MPRPIVAGTTYLLTRRCTQRQYLLRPSAATNQAFLYIIATGAKRFQVELHAICVMSNHWHAVITDVLGNMPAFVEYVHKLVAKYQNASLGRWENLWATEPPSLIPLRSREDVLDKIAYTLANPVSAGLVSRSSEWPGVLLGPVGLGQTLQVHRPKTFFRPTGPMPPTVQLVLSRPSVWDNDRDYVAQVQVQLAQREQSARSHYQKGGFLGRRKVLKQRPTDAPRSRELRRQLHPKISAHNRWLRLECVTRLKAFVTAYRQALAEWKRGIYDVVFPHGTYALRLRAHVLCENTS